MAYVPITDFGDDSVNADASAGIFIHDDSHPRAAIVHVFGEATFADANELESIVVSVIRIGKLVVIDFRECAYMDCATLGVLVRAAKTLGDQLRLVFGRPSQGFRMLDITGLARVLHVFETIDAAVAPIVDAPPPARLRSV